MFKFGNIQITDHRGIHKTSSITAIIAVYDSEYLRENNTKELSDQDIVQTNSIYELAASKQNDGSWKSCIFISRDRKPFWESTNSHKDEHMSDDAKMKTALSEAVNKFYELILGSFNTELYSKLN